MSYALMKRDARAQLVADLDRAARIYARALSAIPADHADAAQARADLRRDMRRLVAMADAYPDSVRVQIAAARLRRVMARAWYGHADAHDSCGGLWVGGECTACGARCTCSLCRAMGA